MMRWCRERVLAPGDSIVFEGLGERRFGLRLEKSSGRRRCRRRRPTRSRPRPAAAAPPPPPGPPPASRRDLRQPLRRVREAAQLLLREDELAVHAHLELTTAALDERALHAAFLLELGRQTGGPGKIVSSDAVTDLDGHGGYLRDDAAPTRGAASILPAPPV